ncbi:MAG: SDR family oxidoreductase [Polyangiaceae bacterium]|nr:SDR family oxidoreductase [Polyangiaceae bacterium]
MNGIEGKVVIVTGSSGGIGKATAILLAERGAKVVLGARRQDQLARVAEQITRSGGQVVFGSVDVRRRDDLCKLVHLARGQFGRLDVLVSNAGVGLISPIDELRVEDWNTMIDVNFRGVLYGVAAALPAFRAQGSGHFVNVLSTAGLRIVPMQGVYAATKNAVRTFAESLRQEAGNKVRVTNVSPGFVRTDFVESVPNEALKQQSREQRDRIAIEPDAIARAILFAIEQPADVDVGDIVLRPTAQN